MPLLEQIPVLVLTYWPGPLLTVAKEHDRQLIYAACDVTSEESVTKAFAKAETTSRHPIRGLVACAGISGRAKATEYPTASFRKIIDVNLIGTFLCAQAAARIMHCQNVAGSLVLLGSMSGTNVNRGVDTAACYASKAGVLQLARNLAAEWGNDGEHPPIRVNTLSPGYILTPITIPTFETLQGIKDLWEGGNMLGRLSTFEKHQSSVLYLLSDGSSYMTGADLRVDGGHCAWSEYRSVK